MSDQETREALFELWMRFGTTIESDSSEGWEMVDAILARFAVTPKDETEWEYGVSWLEGEDRVHLPVDSAWRAGVEVRRISLGYPNPEENFVSRRRKAGPWEPAPKEEEA